MGTAAIIAPSGFLPSGTLPTPRRNAILSVCVCAFVPWKSKATSSPRALAGWTLSCNHHTQPPKAHRKFKSVKSVCNVFARNASECWDPTIVLGWSWRRQIIVRLITHPAWLPDVKPTCGVFDWFKSLHDRQQGSERCDRCESDVKNTYTIYTQIYVSKF